MTCGLRKNLGNREERFEYVTATGLASVDLSQFFRTRDRLPHRPHAAGTGKLKSPTQLGRPNPQSKRFIAAVVFRSGNGRDSLRF
jgi:hypothetical protein